jgi:hypothetical protein
MYALYKCKESITTTVLGIIEDNYMSSLTKHIALCRKVDFPNQPIFFINIVKESKFVTFTDIDKQLFKLVGVRDANAFPSGKRV